MQVRTSQVVPCGSIRRRSSPTTAVRCRMKYENGGTKRLILTALFAAEIFWSQAALAIPGSASVRNFEFMALSLHSHGGKIPLIEAPSDAAAIAEYPLRLRKTTSVIELDCSVGEHGAVTSCKMNRSDPDDAALKAAALKLSHRFKVSPSYPYSSLILFLRFSGRVDRCLMPFCFPDSIKPPPHIH